MKLSEKKNHFQSYSSEVKRKSRVSGSKTSKPKSKQRKKRVIDESQHNKVVITDEIDIDRILKITENMKKKESVPIVSVSKESDKIDKASYDVTSTNTVQSYADAIDFLEKHKIKISTITLDCKLHTLIDVDTFSQNVELKENEIVCIKYGNRNNTATNRTIVSLTPKKKPSTRVFFNQVTILMKPTNNPERNFINIKVFKNGSLQMTGCKDMNDFINVTNTLIRILKTGKENTQYIDSPETIGIYDAKIRLINSNFDVNYEIDKKRLADILKEQHHKYTKDIEIGFVKFKYSSSGNHSCVNIKYIYEDGAGVSDLRSQVSAPLIGGPSIFVFRSGSIIITGAKNLQQIIAAYHYIQKILAKYLTQIKIVKLDPIAVQKEIMKFINQRNLLKR